MSDIADPLHGWHPQDVQDNPKGPTGNDVYGNLARHVHRTLCNFIQRLSSLPETRFRLWQVDIRDKGLTQLAQENYFDRIEVSLLILN